MLETTLELHFRTGAVLIYMATSKVKSRKEGKRERQRKREKLRERDIERERGEKKKSRETIKKKTLLFLALSTLS